MDAITTRSLTKAFGDHVAVDHLTFTVESGRVTGFLGPNGAGKTTTLRMILGLFRPTSGHGAIMGRPYHELADPVRTVGAVLETSQFHPLRSGRNHLKVLASAAEIPERRIDEVLEMVELEGQAKKKVGQYSLGMRQRLGIAAALLGNPRILVMDEPANGLDPAGIRWLRTFLRAFAAEDRVVFVSSHLLREISAMAHDVVVINKGKLVTRASIETLLQRASHGVRVQTSDPERLHNVLGAAGHEAKGTSNGELFVATSAQVVGMLAAEAGIPILGLREQERDLEDVFFELTESQVGRSDP